MVRRPTYALSVKQPWAALLVAGRKTVEIRRWATSVRGRVYIHAARGADDRPAGWTHVSDELRPMAEQTGGLIGTAELAACVLYRTAPGFAAETNRHLNAADWFVPPRMYGFEFRNPAVVPFITYKGSVRFFTIELPEPA